MTMSCRERRDLLALLAVGALDEHEASALRAHVDSGCPECVGALAEAEAMLAHLPLTLGPTEPSTEVRRQLLERVEADLAADPARAEISEFPAQGAPRRATWWQPVAAAAAAAVVTWIAVSLPLRERQAILGAEVARQAGRIEQLEQAVRDADGLLQVLRSPEMLLVSVTGTDQQTGAAGRILWNRERDLWHLSVSGMTAAPAGKTYQLWFVTEAEEKISAGTFSVDASGNATLLAPVPEGIGTVVLAAVTDEPTGGSDQPTGAFQLLGQVPRSKT